LSSVKTPVQGKTNPDALNQIEHDNSVHLGYTNIDSHDAFLRDAAASDNCAVISYKAADKKVE
jgi:hypothetical protein